MVANGGGGDPRNGGGVLVILLLDTANAAKAKDQGEGFMGIEKAKEPAKKKLKRKRGPSVQAHHAPGHIREQSWKRQGGGGETK